MEQAVVEGLKFLALNRLFAFEIGTVFVSKNFFRSKQTLCSKQIYFFQIKIYHYIFVQ